MARTLVLLFVGCILAVVSIAVHVGDVKPKTSDAKAQATEGKKTKSKVKSPEQRVECAKCLCKETKKPNGDILKDGGEENGRLNCNECHDLTVGEFNHEQEKLSTLYKCADQALDQEALNLCGKDFEKLDKKNGVCSGEGAKGNCADCLCMKTRDLKGRIRSDGGRKTGQLKCGVCQALTMTEFNKEQEKFKALYECTSKASNDKDELDACAKEFDAGDVCKKEQAAAQAAAEGGAAPNAAQAAGDGEGPDAQKGKTDNDNGGSKGGDKDKGPAPAGADAAAEGAAPAAEGAAPAAEGDAAPAAEGA